MLNIGITTEDAINFIERVHALAEIQEFDMETVPQHSSSNSLTKQFHQIVILNLLQ
jgi:hypothetical protein